MSYLIAAFFGVLFGNYATTYYHRLPLGKPINGRTRLDGIKPHCSKCGHQLKFYEYFPVFSWVFATVKCNYCGEKIDPIYTVLEVSVMVYAIFLNYMVGFNELYPALLVLGCLVFLHLSLYLKHKKSYIQVKYAMYFLVVIIFLQVSYGIT